MSRPTPSDIIFTDETPSGDIVSLWVDDEERDLVIEVEGEEDYRSVFGNPTETYRVSLPRLLNMVDHHTDLPLRFLQQINR